MPLPVCLIFGIRFSTSFIILGILSGKDNKTSRIRHKYLPQTASGEAVYGFFIRIKYRQNLNQADLFTKTTNFRFDTSELLIETY